MSLFYRSIISVTKNLHRFTRYAGFFLLPFVISCNQQEPAVINTGTPTPLPVVKDSGTVANRQGSAEVTAKNSEQRASPSSNQADEGNSFNVKTFYDSSTQWGYEIYFGSKLIIRQKNIPAIPGVKGFSSEEKAKKTGNYVAYKIINNIFPPSLSKKELDSLQVL